MGYPATTGYNTVSYPSTGKGGTVVSSSYTYTRLMSLFDMLDAELAHYGDELTQSQEMELQQRAQYLRQALIRLATLADVRDHIGGHEVLPGKLLSLV